MTYYVTARVITITSRQCPKLCSLMFLVILCRKSIPGYKDYDLNISMLQIIPGLGGGGGITEPLLPVLWTGVYIYIYTCF